MRLIDADAIKYDFSIKTYADNGVIVTSLLADKDTIDAMPTVEPEPCEDVVSRNAIVQKLNKMDRYVSEELRLCDTDKKFPKNEVFIVDDVYEEIAEKLPSAQPEVLACGNGELYTHPEMTTTAITQAKIFCRYQGIMCEYATDMGCCEITGCAKRRTGWMI